MKRFLQAIDDEDNPINLLDAPQAAGYAPELIKYV